MPTLMVCMMTAFLGEERQAWEKKGLGFYCPLPFSVDLRLSALCLTGLLIGTRVSSSSGRDLVAYAV